MVDLSSLAIELPWGLTIDKSVDAGAFLTSLTLVAGFAAWSVKTIKEWRKTSRQEAENGALRLLLKILRERTRRRPDLARRASQGVL